MYNGKVVSVEETKLDVDGLNIQLSSTLFQQIIQVNKQVFKLFAKANAIDSSPTFRGIYMDGLVLVSSILFPDSGGGECPAPSSMLFHDSGFEITEEPLGRNPVC